MPVVNTPIGQIQFPEGTPPEEMERVIAEGIEAERARLTQERDAALEDSPSTLGAVGTGLKQAALQGVSGAGQAVLGAGQAAADLLDLENISGALGRQSQRLEEATVDFNQRIGQEVLGRAATDDEAAKLADEARAGMSRSEFGIKILAGLAGGQIATGAKTAAGAVGLGTFEGALTGALLGDSDGETIEQRRADRIGDATLGAALGGAFGLFPAALAGGKNFLARTVEKFSKNADEGFKLADEFGVPISLGQASGNPIIRQMELQAQGEFAQSLLTQQADNLAAKLGARIGVAVKPLDDVGEGLAQNVDDVARRVEQVLATSRIARNKAWRDAMESADEITGGAGIYRPFDFVTDLRKAKEQIAEQFGATTMRSGTVIDDILKEADAAIKGDGATAKQLQNWLVRLTGAKGSGVGILKGMDEAVDRQVINEVYKGQAQSIAGALTRSLKGSIDGIEVGFTRGHPIRQAVDTIKQARRAYGGATENIRQIEREFMGALGLNGTPQQILQRLGNADPQVVRRAIQVVDRMAGGEIWKQNLRSGIFEAAVDAGLQGAKQKGFSTGAMDVASFVDAFAANSQRSTLAGIQSASQEVTARRGIDLARRILDEPNAQSAVGVIKTTLPVGLQEAAINVVSRDPGFMTRLLAGAVSRGKGADWLFYHPDGIKLLQSLRNVKVRAPRLTALRNTAVVTLGSMFNTNSPSQEKERQQ